MLKKEVIEILQSYNIKVTEGKISLSDLEKITAKDTSPLKIIEYNLRDANNATNKTLKDLREVLTVIKDNKLFEDIYDDLLAYTEALDEGRNEFKEYLRDFRKEMS